MKENDLNLFNLFLHRLSLLLQKTGKALAILSQKFCFIWTRRSDLLKLTFGRLIVADLDSFSVSLCGSNTTGTDAFSLILKPWQSLCVSIEEYLLQNFSHG